MDTHMLTGLIAQLPESTIYVSPIKLIVILLLFPGWIFFAQWADRDAARVNTFRNVWNMLSLIVGLVGLLLLLFVPIFFAAIAAYAVTVGAFMIAYVIHRNGLVVAEDRVCTSAHIRRVLTKGFAKDKDKRAAKEVKENVRITGADGEIVQIPEDPDERDTYAVVQELLFDALRRRSQRVELLPAGQVTHARVYVDGSKTEREPLERQLGDRVLGFFKGVSGLDLAERRKPQKGEIMASVAKLTYDMVVRTNGSTAGETLTLRIVGDEKNFKVKDVGFTAPQLEQVQKLLSAENGLVLISAPPRSGLTTTVYSFGRSNDAFLQNIQTQEYEREVELENITQHIYKQADGRTFTDELLRVVRSDPDVLVLPAVRDKASATVAAQAAVGRPTVYVGLPSGDLLDAMRKWLALVDDPALVAKGLRAVIHQRLVRVLCPTCKTAYKPDAAMLQKINAPKDTLLYRPPEPQADKHGNPIICPNCDGAGYVGRTGIFTILEVDDELRKVIAGGGSLADIRAVALKRGALSLQQHALQKAFEGTTSIEEIRRATRVPSTADQKKKKQ
jgi:type II secretory ATPase GspE/PulE/Tfp pilus assembly ATPase PilB-like protein